MRVLGVLDVMNGQVVRGIRGRRAEYRPIESSLVASSRPLDVAEALRARFGLSELYVADLDAIGGAPPAMSLYQCLHDSSFRLWVDAGLRIASDAQPLAASKVHKIVAGLETAAGPQALADLCNKYDSEHVAFSLDLRDGRPLGDSRAWGTKEPYAIAVRAIELGVRSIILLDLSRVGAGEGTGTEALLKRLAQSYPETEWLVGGGVRNAQDLRHLKALGAGGVLLASALHDGRIGPDDVAAC